MSQNSTLPTTELPPSAMLASSAEHLLRHLRGETYRDSATSTWLLRRTPGGQVLERLQDLADLIATSGQREAAGPRWCRLAGARKGVRSAATGDIASIDARITPSAVAGWRTPPETQRVADILLER